MKQKGFLLPIVGLILVTFAAGVYLIFVRPKKNDEPSKPTIKRDNSDKTKESGGGVLIPFGMRFPPIDKVCDYDIAVIWRDNIMTKAGKPKLEILDKASSCGTKVVIRLFGVTADIVDGNSHLSLDMLEDRINDFNGLIEPYIENGTIIANIIIDEPHDCKNDWGGVCPTPEEVESASRISKKYWPNLPTMTNTVPEYALKFTWKDTNYINFQYSYHKGSLTNFVNKATSLLDDGKVSNISWSIMAGQGGCPQFGDCPMIPQQVKEVAETMCATGKGLYISFSSYQEKLMTPEMLTTISDLKKFCANPT